MFKMENWTVSKTKSAGSSDPDAAPHAFMSQLWDQINYI